MANIIRRHLRPIFVSDLQDEINRLFDVSLPGAGNGSGASEFLPQVDIKDEKDHYLVKADLPGIDPKNLDVSLNENILTIRGKKEDESVEKKEGYVRMERSTGTFCRQFSLPDVLDAEKIKAKCRHGVLEVVIPKSKKSSMHKIDIKSEE